MAYPPFSGLVTGPHFVRSALPPVARRHSAISRTMSDIPIQIVALSLPPICSRLPLLQVSSRFSCILLSRLSSSSRSGPQCKKSLGCRSKCQKCSLLNTSCKYSLISSSNNAFFSCQLYIPSLCLFFQFVVLNQILFFVQLLELGKFLCVEQFCVPALKYFL